LKNPFSDFFPINDTTGQGFFDVLQNELKSLDIDIDDERRQVYDNGATHEKIQKQCTKENFGCKSQGFLFYL
jgi:hypothetical protein